MEWKRSKRSSIKQTFGHFSNQRVQSWMNFLLWKMGLSAPRAVKHGSCLHPSSCFLRVTLNNCIKVSLRPVMQKFFHSVPNPGRLTSRRSAELPRQDIYPNTELAVFFTKITLRPFRKQPVMSDSPPSTLTAPSPLPLHRKKNSWKNNWIVPLLKKIYILQTSQP